METMEVLTGTSAMMMNLDSAVTTVADVELIFVSSGPGLCL
jgi:hypothetical protein